MLALFSTAFCQFLIKNMMMMMIDIPFGMEKLEWLGYHAEGEKISKIPLFILALLTNVTDRQTDRQTPHAGNSCAYA